MADLVILGGARTPTGFIQGLLAPFPATVLGSLALRGAVSRSGVPVEAITDVVFGHALQAGAGQAPARQAAEGADLSDHARCTTVNKGGASGLEAVVMGCRLLVSGESTAVAAGGMESMSRAPFLLQEARSGWTQGHRQVQDAILQDGLWDPYDHLHLGECAEHCAQRHALSRGQQDAYAAEGRRRARTAAESGHLVAEIVPVASGSGALIGADQGPLPGDLTDLATLSPLFLAEGTVTAGTSAGAADGAAAVVLSTAQQAATRGWSPLARVVSWGAYAQEPGWFTTAPAPAVRRALACAGWRADQVDLWEVDEAFAVIPLALAGDLDLSLAHVNIHGGDLAYGHALGSGGARHLVSLVHALRRRGGGRGCTVAAAAGGEALAVCIECLP
jgi:acetyl-CoA C-acetyltransferase